MTKIDGTTIDNTKDLDLVMPMYNLILRFQIQFELFWHDR